MITKILSFIERRKKEVKKLYDRTLPINEYFNDRWEKAKELNFGKGTSIYDNSYIFGEVTIGENTWVGPFTILDGTGGLKIGSNCSISAGVHIYTHDSVKWAISGGSEVYEYESVEIGDNCYIGPNTVIAKGVKIGSQCIIGANSFVNTDIPEGIKAAGSPVRLIK